MLDQLFWGRDSLISEKEESPSSLSCLLFGGHHHVGGDPTLKTIGKTFDNPDQAKTWIINNQLARRNLPTAYEILH